MTGQTQIYKKRLLLFAFAIFIGFSVVMTWFFINYAIPFEDYVMTLLAATALFIGSICGSTTSLIFSFVILFLYGSFKVGFALWRQNQTPVDASRLFWLLIVPFGGYVGGGLEKIISDITERLTILSTQIDSLVVIDEQTGLETSKRFAFRMNEELARQKRYGGYFSILLIKVAFLKELTDVHGERTKGLVIRNVAQILKSSKRTEDLLARIDEAEFAFLLPNTEREGTDIFAERIRQKLQYVDIALGENDFRRIRLTPQTGSAVCPADSQEYVSLMTLARKEYEYSHH